MVAPESAPWQPTREDLLAAQQRIAPYVERTPLLRARNLDRGECRVFLKPECLQRTGSFKVRGAFNALAALPPDVRARGVITHSSGNFAQALALAARELGLAEQGKPYPCTVCMPEHANPIKVAKTRALGAEILFAGVSSEDRKIKADELVAETGRALIPSYDHPDIICGQGTLGLEILEQHAETKARLALVAGPVGGGGLLGGTAAALRSGGYAGPIAGVEPESGDDFCRSLSAGKRVRIETPQSLCDGLLAVIPGAVTFPVLQKAGVCGVTVSEDAVKSAAAWLLNEAKLLVEPSGAVTVAAWRTGALDAMLCGETGDAVLILSGGNTDPSLVSGWTA